MENTSVLSSTQKIKAALKKIPLLALTAKYTYRGYQKLKFSFKPLAKKIIFYSNFFCKVMLLNNVLAKVEFYQPLYGFSFKRNNQAQRNCVDRAEAIYQKTRNWGNGGQIFDIGCSLGYFSYYFADRGYIATGIDSNANNVRTCQLLQKLNNLGNVNFSQAELSQEYVAQMPDHVYDFGLLLSVAHHIIYYKGLSYTQALMAQLLEKVPVLFVELAIRDELTDSPWLEHLPQDELAIFAQCSNIHIEKLGLFSNHLSATRRPLYMVSKRSLTLLDQEYQIADRKFIAYDGAQYIDRKYYDCGDRFIKKYLLNQADHNQAQIKQEINHYQNLPNNDFFPQMLDHRIEEKSISISLSKLPGKNLHDLLSQGEQVPALKIFTDIVTGLSFLLSHGLYHNDVRLWNVMWDGQKAYLLDLGFTSPSETENTNLALLWIITQLHRFNFYDLKNPLQTAPTLDCTQLSPAFQPIVTALQNSDFAKFIGWFDQNKTSLAVA